MKRFVVPPNWPSPPRRNWIPPKSWRPDPSWPPAPEGWRFWVDGKGYPVLGPIGRYGAPPPRAVYAGAAALVVLLGVNVWAVSAIGVFDRGSDDAVAVRFVDRASASPTGAASSTTPAVPRTTAAPTSTQTVVTPSREARRSTQRSTARPTRTPTAARTTERTRSTASPKPTSKPTSTTTRTTSPRSPRPTTSPSTRDELLQQYCIQQGIDPAWCDPSIWRSSRDR